MEQTHEKKPFIVSLNGAALTFLAGLIVSDICYDFGGSVGEFMAQGFGVTEETIPAWIDSGQRIGWSVGFMLPIWAASNLAYNAGKNPKPKKEVQKNLEEETLESES